MQNTNARIRLSSIEPTEINEDLISILRDEPRLCKYLHIPVQSLSDSVLKKMCRPYSAKDFSKMINHLKNEIPSIAIGIDIILGFPSETEENFLETFNNLENLPINHFHVFNYSPREGTIAAQMKQIDSSEKKFRVSKTLALAVKKNLSYRKNLIGTNSEILTEIFKDNFTEGHGGDYTKIYIHKKVPTNEIIKVKLTEIYKDGMIGVVENEPE